MSCPDVSGQSWGRWGRKRSQTPSVPRSLFGLLYMLEGPSLSLTASQLSPCLLLVELPRASPRTRPFHSRPSDHALDLLRPRLPPLDLLPQDILASLEAADGRSKGCVEDELELIDRPGSAVVVADGSGDLPLDRHYGAAY